MVHIDGCAMIVGLYVVVRAMSLLVELGFTTVVRDAYLVLPLCFLFHNVEAMPMMKLGGDYETIFDDGSPILFDEFGVDDGEAIRSGADYEAVASDGVAIN